MLQKKRHPWIAVLTVLMFFIITILYLSDVIDISIKNATPMILLPMLTTFAIFSDIKFSALTGFLLGICIDSVMVGAYCFNAIVLMLIGVFSCLFANRFFNKNFKAAAVMSLLTSIVYFSLHWLVFFVFPINVKQSITYLLVYAMPSAVYSAVFVLPFYYIFKYISKIKSK